MSDNSDIEWTDATWNPVRGCIKVSPGCKNCYAETFAERFRGVAGHPYEQGFDLRLVPEKLAEPLSWKKPRRVFVNSMSDLFHEDVPDAFIDKVFAVMAQAEQHTFQILTKRGARMLDYMKRLDRITRSECEPMPVAYWYGTERRGWPLPNVWLGVSVENQHFADERIPLLLQTPAAVRFISAEPLLGPVNLEPFLQYEPFHEHYKMTFGASEWRGLDWVIVGGESGPGARPFDLAWGRSIVAQCQAAGVPVFVKQLGARAYGPDTHSAILRDRKGGDMSEWPADLRVRQYPEAR